LLKKQEVLGPTENITTAGHARKEVCFLAHKIFHKIVGYSFTECIEVKYEGFRREMIRVYE
jgi:hypothetical protein